MSKFSNVKEKASDLFSYVGTHWKTPPKGKYVSYSEIAKYSVGGMGKDMLWYFINFMFLSAGNTLLGATIGIKPMHLQYIAMAVSLLNLGWLFVRGYIMDNINTKLGKFRPIIIVVGIPLAVVTSIFMFLDFEVMSYSEKLINVIIFAGCIELIKPFLNDSFIGLGQVMSPNTAERANIITIYSIAYSAAPTIYGFFVPFLSQFTGGLTNINTYRFIVLPVGLIGVALTFVAAFGVKERTVVAKNYVQKVNVFRGMKMVFRNKYWWIRNTAGWVAFMEDAFKSIFAWMFIYGFQDMTAYSLINSIIGESALIAMLLTPLMLAKLGNRKLLIIHNASNLIFLLGMLLCLDKLAFFVIFLFCNSLVNYFTLVYNPILEGEVKDYQHYLMGKRVDGCFAAATVINIPITLGAGFIIPFLYECFGMTTNYDILYDAKVRSVMFTILLVMSIVGALINLIPFFFYDYSREKHVSFMKVIRLRAVLQDFIEGKIDPLEIKRVVEDKQDSIRIRDSKIEDNTEYKRQLRELKSTIGLTKEEKLDRKQQIDNIKKSNIEKNEKAREIEKIKGNFKAILKERKAPYKQLKKEYIANRKLKEEKKNIHIYFDEIEKYSKPEGLFRLAMIEQIEQLGINEISKMSEEEIKQFVGKNIEYLKELEDKKAYKILDKYTHKLIKLSKSMRKNYKEGFYGIDKNMLDKANAMPSTTDIEKKERLKAQKKAKTELAIYDKVMNFYEEEMLFYDIYKGLERFSELEAKYEECCEIVAREDEERAKQLKAEKERKKEEIARIKQAKKDKKKRKKEGQ